MSTKNKIYLVRGNDTDMSVCVQRREESGDPVPYDLSGAEDVRLSLTGHGTHVFAKNVSVTGASSNIITGRMTGRMLLGVYDLEVTFTLGGMAKRFSVQDLVEVVDHLEDDSDGEAEGEGDGIVVTLIIQPEIIEVAGITRDELNAGLALKVDKIEGKGLSANDYTDGEKEKLGNLPTAETLAGDLDAKVDKVPGKGLSESDFTSGEKDKLAGIAAGAQVNVIETVKVGGTSLEVVSKAVNIPVDSAPTAGSGNLATSGGIQAAIKAVRDALALIEAVVPTQASADNELADKEFVNSSISTNTAEFRGTVNAVSELPTTGVDDNDYAFVISIDSAGNTVYNRYKFTPSNGWIFEYALNNSSFTSEQWAAIQSGMTAALVTKLKALPTAAALETSLGLKVDKVTGKGLSTNDYTDGEKAKLAALPTADALSTSLAGKVDKIEGKGLSTEDYTTTEKNKLAGIEEGAQVNLPVDETPTEGSDNPVSSGGMHAILTPVEEAGAEFLERVAPVNGKTSLGVTRIKGKTVAWNQLVKNGDFSNNNDWSLNNSSISDGYLSFTGVNYYNPIASQEINIPRGRKILLRCRYAMTGSCDAWVELKNTESIALPPIIMRDTGSLSIFTERSLFLDTTDSARDINRIGIFGVDSENAFSVKIDNIYVIDLTLMFGAGNEPETMEEFEAIVREESEDYSPGELVNVAASGVKTVGFNQWDEEWLAGYINTENGAFVQYTGAICPRSFIPVMPSKTYYFRSSFNIPAAVAIIYYDKGKNFISSITLAANEFTPPPGAYYIKWHTFQLASYDSSICINLSNPDRNGEYEPYKEDVVPLGLNSFKVKDSSGNILEINGLASAGDVRDEIVGGKLIKRVGRVDLGTLAWNKGNVQSYDNNLCNYYVSGFATDAKNGGKYICGKYINDASGETSWESRDPYTISIDGGQYIIMVESNSYTAASLAEALSGVMLYYELATPIEYDLAEPRAWVAEREDGGTETVLPLDSDPPIVPPILDLKYGDYAEEIAPFLKSDLASAESVKAMLEAMKTAGVISAYTMTWNKSARRYDFTITQ